MISMRLISFFSVLLVLIADIKCANILGVLHVSGRSHYMACSTLMKILATKGHNVTVISAHKEKNPPKNYHQIYLDNLYTENEHLNLFEMNPHTLLKPMIFQIMGNDLVEKAFNHTTFKQFMNSKEKFDAVIIEEFESEPVKYVAHHFNAPLIVYSSVDANFWTNPYQGNPDTPSYNPSYFLAHLTNRMSFFERVENTLMYVYSKLYSHFLTFPSQNRLLHKYYPDAPDLVDIAYNVSLVLLNSDASVHEPTPKVPSMKEIGGFHIKKPKPLPQDLQAIVDNAKHGVIFFSLGTNVKSADMPEHKKKFILKKFSRMKETIIWKFEDSNLPGKPDNLIVSNWLPQNDILAHKNVKLFITHGGLFSTMEAVYHGVPMLAISIFAEQELNGKRAEAFGFARHIPFNELTEDNFSDALDDVLTNPKYKENAIARSHIFKDKPMEPADALNYWVDYVVRHKGAPHLRVASLDLEWYQYLLIDVVLFIIAMAVVFIMTVSFLVRRLFRKDKIKEKKN